MILMIIFTESGELQEELMELEELYFLYTLMNLVSSDS
jgi:hypothetical protein